MKKKILLVLPSFQCGGTVRSARSFVELHDEEKYDIDVFCLQKVGEFETYFKKCKVLNENVELTTAISFNTSYKHHNLLNKIKAFYFYLKKKIDKKYDFEKVFKKISRKIEKKANYDCIMVFQEGLATQFASYMLNKNKIAWVRCDYSRYYNMVKKDETKIYENYKKIVCVSKYTATIFCEYFITFKEKVMAIHNLIDYKSILNESKKNIENSNYQNSQFTIVSIGRMDPVKQFSYIPPIAAKLCKNHINFKWYIIGDGGAEKFIVQEKIKEYDVVDKVIMLGSIQNPYPYIKNSNLLVCLSSSEACPNVINEAKILHIPIITTDFASVYEYIEHLKNGIISKIENIDEAIMSFINDENIRNNIEKNIQNYEYNNTEIFEKINNLILEEK